MRIRPALSLALALCAPPAARAAAVAHDYDGDGRSDYPVYYRAVGTWYVYQSSSGAMTWDWGWSDAIPVHGDFDGDRAADVAVYHRERGDWYVWASSGVGASAFNWGWSEAAAVPADYDGDGLTDPAVYHAATGSWYLRRSRDGAAALRWGWSEARPVPADYDGDGRADLAVYHPGSGTWHIAQTSAGNRVEGFGWNEALPVPADYDGDGRADVALYHPESGNWFVQQSSGGTRIETWGSAVAGAVPGDYDGDGRADLAVYAPGTGDWYVLPSGGPWYRLPWGWSDGRAVPGWAHGAREGVKVLAFGDSITYGIGTSADGPATSYPALLERRVEGAHGGDLVFVNVGIGGEVTQGGRNRIGAVLDEHRPDFLLLMEGTNDHMRGVPFDEVEGNLRTMVGAAQARGVRAILATIPPVISTPTQDRTLQQQRIVAFNPRIPGIAAAFGIPVARVYEAITAQPSWQTRLMDQASGNHPNDRGHQVMRDVWNALVGADLAAGIVY